MGYTICVLTENIKGLGVDQGNGFKVKDLGFREFRFRVERFES
jgi:hypothetical protein